MAAAGRKQTSKTSKGAQQEVTDVLVYWFNEDKTTGLSGSEDDIWEEETPVVEKHGKKRPVIMPIHDVDDDEEVNMGGEVHNMLEKFGADISKAMQAKRKRLEMYTKTSLKNSNQKLKQMWKTQQNQRQKLTEDYSQQFFSVLQQWEVDVQKSEEQEEKMTNLFRQQQKVFQQARIVQNQKLKTIKQMYEQFLKNMEDMEKNQETFLMGAQSELRKEMAMLQNKIMMDTQQQEMATVRKSLQSMLF